MSKLRWEVMPTIMTGMEIWGAKEGLTTFMIGKDTGCRKDDTYYGRFSVSRRLPGSPTVDLGVFDTLEQAKDAAEQSRRQQ